MISIQKPIAIIFHKKNLIGKRFFLFMVALSFCKGLLAQRTDTTFEWPDDKKAVISLTFDDARLSQVEAGTAFLDTYGCKATFFVVPANVELRLDGWKKAVASGHEIGNHTMRHPCTANFVWSRKNA